MNEMLKNFKWQREDEPQNMMSYVFLFINFVYGITFTFFSHSSVVVGSAFYMAPFPVVLWGLVTLTIAILTVYTIAKRPRRLGEWTGMIGFLAWTYGMVLYVASGSYFAALAIYVPQMLFWTFWYIGVKRFYARQDVREKYKETVL